MQNLLVARGQEHVAAHATNRVKPLIGQDLQQIDAALLATASFRPRHLRVPERIHKPADVRLHVARFLGTPAHRRREGRQLAQRVSSRRR